MKNMRLFNSVFNKVFPIRGSITAPHSHNGTSVIYIRFDQVRICVLKHDDEKITLYS